jgi:hypothetical protein
MCGIRGPEKLISDPGSRPGVKNGIQNPGIKKALDSGSMIADPQHWFLTAKSYQL